MTVTTTQRDLLPARSTDLTHSLFAVVFTLTVCDFAFGLVAFTETVLSPADLFTSNDPMPLLESAADTRRVTPFLVFADRIDCTDTADSGTVAEAPAAELVVGAVVSRMMSSDCASDGLPSRVTNLTYTTLGRRSSFVATRVHSMSADASVRVKVLAVLNPPPTTQVAGNELLFKVSGQRGLSTRACASSTRRMRLM